MRKKRSFPPRWEVVGAWEGNPGLCLLCVGAGMRVKTPPDFPPNLPKDTQVIDPVILYPPINPPKLGKAGRFAGKGCAMTARVWTFDLVEARLVEAMGLLDRLPRGGPAPLRAADGPWDLVQPDEWGRGLGFIEALAMMAERREDAARTPRTALSIAEVGRMEEALDWVARYVPAKRELRRVVGAAAAMLARGETIGGRVCWRELKARGRFANSPDALRMSYSRAIGTIAKGLDRARVAVR